MFDRFGFLLQSTNKSLLVWANIRPKLIPLLEMNRTRRLEQERRERRSTRHEKINGYLYRIKRDAHPYQAIIDALGLTIPASKISDFDKRQVLPNPFPRICVALEWDFLKDILEEKYSLERVEELLNQHRAQLDQKVSLWQTSIEDQLVEQYGAEFDQGDQAEKSRDILTVGLT
jgi:hypothetical protein